MTKILQAKFKRSRTNGVDLWGHPKDPFANKRNYPPGQHGNMGYKKLSDYGRQLRAKNRLKDHYGRLTEKQLRNIFKEAKRRKGDTSENLVAILETMLYIVIYRLNLAPSVFAARQLVSHKHVKVDGKVVNIPTYKLKPGQKIEIVEASREMPIILESVQNLHREIPTYLSLDDDKKKQGTFLDLPKFTDIPYPFEVEPNLIVEYYSK